MHFSFNDTFSDSQVANNYLQWTHNITKHVNATNDTLVQNGMFKRCTLTQENTDIIGYTYTCREFQNPWFGILTLGKGSFKNKQAKMA